MAGAGIEPAAFWLWARRATSAPPRYERLVSDIILEGSRYVFLRNPQVKGGILVRQYQVYLTPVYQLQLPLLDSNQDYLLSESSMLAVTSRGKARGLRLHPGMTVLLLDHFTGPLNPVIPTVSTFSKKVHSRSGIFKVSALRLSRYLIRPFFYRQPCGLFEGATPLRAKSDQRISGLGPLILPDSPKESDITLLSSNAEAVFPFLVHVVGFEPTTDLLIANCSAIELYKRTHTGGATSVVSVSFGYPNATPPR